MSLSDDELNQVYGSLARFAKETNLDWVVSEVERQISIGKVSTKSVSPPDLEAREQMLEARPRQMELDLPQSHEMEPEKKKPRRRRAMTMVVSEEYNPREKALLLIDALKTSVAEPIQIASYLSDYMRENLPNVGPIEFYADESGGSIFVLKDRELETHKESAEKLVELLTKLEGVVTDESSG